MFIALTAIDTTLIALVGAQHIKEAVSRRILAENNSGYSTSVYNEAGGALRRNIALSASLHTRTLSPDKLLLYLVKLLPCTQQGHTLTPTTREVVSNRICGFFLCLNTIAGGGIGRKRERQPF